MRLCLFYIAFCAPSLCVIKGNYMTHLAKCLKRVKSLQMQCQAGERQKGNNENNMCIVM